MQEAGRRIVFVHAHPDDEGLFTGGTIARYVRDGAHVCLVTCTDGELGEIADDDGIDPEEIAPRLGEVRRQELREACRILGLQDLRMLGYRDSGMEGTEGNDDPRSFVNQDLGEVVERLVAIYRELRPQVVVTYNDFGFYGHPDHIRAHQAAVAALDAAADTAYNPHLGPPHAVSKLYYTAIPRSRLAELKARAADLGPEAEAFHDMLTEETIQAIGTDDHLVTTCIDVREFVITKFESLLAHRTQRGTTAPFLAMPHDVRLQVFGEEYFARVRPSDHAPGTEEDLFEGVAG